MGKDSYERSAYESVDDGIPSGVTSQKSTESKIQAVKGSRKQNIFKHSARGDTPPKSS